jgi:hypothetical protein
MKNLYLLIVLAILFMAGCSTVSKGVSTDVVNTNSVDAWKTGWMSDGSVRATGEASKSTPALAQKIADDRSKTNALKFIFQEAGIEWDGSSIEVQARIVKRKPKGNTWTSLAEISTQGVSNILQKYKK